MPEPSTTIGEEDVHGGVLDIGDPHLQRFNV